jgi:hypothetical protein
MEKEELLKYELPSYSEYISNPFLQEIVARMCARRINRKLRIYEKRKARELFFSTITKDNK